MDLSHEQSSMCVFDSQHDQKFGTYQWVYPGEVSFVIQPEMCFKSEEVCSLGLFVFT